MRFNGVAVSALLVVTVCCVGVQADEFRHEATVMGKMGNHPNITQFTGPTTLDVTFTDSPTGVNPLYEGQTMHGENPLYDSLANPGTQGALQWISFELDNTNLTPFLHEQGVVHRDIAARNFLVQTNGGQYQSAPGEFLLFGNDGPPDIRTSGGVGPIRWMAPESLRLYPVGDPDGTDPNDYFEVQPFSFFEVTYVPEPSALLLILTLSGLAAGRRSH